MASDRRIRRKSGRWYIDVGDSRTNAALVELFGGAVYTNVVRDARERRTGRSLNVWECTFSQLKKVLASQPWDGFKLQVFEPVRGRKFILKRCAPTQLNVLMGKKGGRDLKTVKPEDLQQKAKSRQF